jgi:ketosteroid isomerase-like protein
MGRFLSDGYFLAIGVQGQPLQVVPRQAWLENLKVYVTHSFHVDDMQVHVYGDTAVVLMLATQHATVRGQERSAQFLITDIWVKEAAGWRVAERHSSRPEPPAVVRPC